MSKLSIGVIIGSTRQGRFADKPAQWIAQLGAQRTDLQLELVDLRNHPLPFFDEPIPPIAAPPKGEAAIQWGKTMARFDGYIVLTPEYNHSPPGVLKNALDYAYYEYSRKPVAFVGYGGVGAARAVQALRLTVVMLGMAPLGKAVHIGGAEIAGVNSGKGFSDFSHLTQAANAMFDDLAWWGNALKTARDSDKK